MKLVDREELMRMPQGTVYQQWSPCILGELMIKGVTITDKADPPENIDWYQNPLGAYINMDEMEFELGVGDCREGCFDPELRYLVYDEAEVKNMISRLQAGLAADPEQFALPFEAQETR